MGNQHPHAMARLGKLGSAMHDITIEKGVSERLGLNMKNLVVTSIDDGSPAHLHGCGAFLGMRLVSINGDFVGSAQEVREKSRGLTYVKVRFIPKELPLIVERKTASEDLGLVFSDDGVLTGTLDGYAAKRCNADQYIGLKIVTVNSRVVNGIADIKAACYSEKLIHLGFSIPLPDNTSGSQRLGSSCTSLSVSSLGDAGDTVSSRPGAASDAQWAQAAQAPVAAESNLLEERQARAKSAASKVARCLSVVSPNKWQHVGGVYLRDEVWCASGWPVWKRESVDEPPRYIYSTPHGYWRVTNDPKDFSVGAGYIITRDRHAGRLPHEMPRWQIKRPEGYIDDPDIRVCLSIASPVTAAPCTAQAAPPSLEEGQLGAPAAGMPGAANGSSAPPAAIPATPAPVPEVELPPLSLRTGMTVRAVCGEHAGKGGPVHFVTGGGGAGGSTVVVVDDSVPASLSPSHHGRRMVTLDTRHAVEEGPDEAAFMWQEGRRELGLRFDNDPTNLTLVNVVAMSAAETFNIGRFAGRLLTHVNGTAVHNINGVKQAVSSAPLLRFAFAPLERLEHNPIITKYLASEQLGRRSIEHEAQAVELMFVQRVFYMMLEHMVSLDTEWEESRRDAAREIHRAITQGKGAPGADDAARPYAERQAFVVAEMRRAAALCRVAYRAEQECAESAAEKDPSSAAEGEPPSCCIVLPSKRERLKTLTARLDDYESALVTAKGLIASLHTAQVHIDELDVIAYTSKRSLARNPSDPSILAGLTKAEEDILKKRGDVGDIVAQLRGLSGVIPQVLSHVLLHDGAGPQLHGE